MVQTLFLNAIGSSQDWSISAEQVAAVKPTWQSGSHAPLKLPKGKAASSGQASGKTLKIDDNSEDLIDEDALLTEEDRQRPAPGHSQ